jgi:hypothetical protein
MQCKGVLLRTLLFGAEQAEKSGQVSQAKARLRAPHGKVRHRYSCAYKKRASVL